MYLYQINLVPSNPLFSLITMAMIHGCGYVSGGDLAGSQLNWDWHWGSWFSSGLAFGVLSKRERFVLIWVLLSGGKKFGFDFFSRPFFYFICHFIVVQQIKTRHIRCKLIALDGMTHSFNRSIPKKVESIKKKYTGEKTIKREYSGKMSISP